MPQNGLGECGVLLASPLEGGVDASIINENVYTVGIFVSDDVGCNLHDTYG